jgi:putative PEP-CTERM system TPR-repeat lipoprotein
MNVALNKSTGVIVTVLMLLVLSCSQQKTVDEYVAQADQAAVAKDYASVVVLLKNAIKQDSKSAKLRFELGKAYIEQGDYASAEKELERAQSLGADFPFFIAKLIEVKVKLNKIDEALTFADSTQTLAESEAVIVYIYAGIAAIQQGEHSKAKEYIEQAIAVKENSIYSQFGKAYLAHIDSEFENGLATIDELLTTHPDFAEALLLKGYLLQASEKFEAAATTFEAYARARPKELQVHFFIAQNYVYAQLFDKAEPEVDLLLKIAEFHPLANQLKAEIEYSRQEYQKAREHALRSYQQDESFHLAKIIAGVSSYQLGDFEQAYQQLTLVETMLSPEHLVKKLIIDLQLKLGYDTEAVSGLNALVDANEADTSMLTMASNQMLAEGNVAAAQELLQSSIDLNSDNPLEIAKQGATQLRLSQSAKGIELLEKALKLDPKLAFAEQSLALGYVASSQYQEAIVIAKKWQLDASKQVQGYLLESVILDKQNNITNAEVLLKKVLELDANNIAALYKLGTYAHKNEEKDLAFNLYTKVLAIKPPHIRAIISFTRLVGTESNLAEKAITYYQGEINKGANNNFSKLGLAYIYRTQQKHQASIDLFKEILASNEPIDGIEMSLGDSYQLTKNYVEAINVYQTYADANPKNLKAAHMLIALFEKTRKVEQAVTQIDKSLKFHKDNIGLLLLKTYYQSMLQIEPSLHDIELLKGNEGAVEHWLFDKMMGNLAYNKKNFSTSSLSYKKAYEKSSIDGNAMNLSRSMALGGDKDKAVAFLENHIAKTKAGSNIKVMLADVYLSSNKTDMAINLYQEIVKADTANVVAFNNLSYLELEKGNNASALSYAEKAMKLATNNPAIIDTYALSLVANGKITAAIEQYEHALALQPNTVEFIIHKAQALLANNQPALAKSTLAAIKEATEQERAQIEELLKSI